MTLLILTTALSLAAAVVSCVCLYKNKRYAQRAHEAQIRAEAASVRATAVSARTEVAATVKKTQEIVASPYSHDLTSTRSVTESPLIRRYPHDRY